jgi:heptosyltransferase-2
MKILIITMAGIGDTLIATPFIHEMRLQYPEAEIDALVLYAPLVDLLRGNPHINQVFQKNLVAASKRETFRFLNGLRALRYDLSINTHPQSRTQYRWIARIINARERLSHSYDCSGWVDRWLVNRSVPQNYDVHGVENNFLLLDLLGKNRLLADPQLEIHLSAEDEKWAEEFASSRRLGTRQPVGFHVGSGATKNLALKRWPLARYIELMRLVLRNHPGAVLLLFGGPQEEADHRAILETLQDERVVIVGSKSLRQAGALMKRCQAFVSVDTALMHLAAAVRAPNQIVIEAPTLNKTNLPYRPDYTVIPNRMINGRNLEYYRYDGRDIQGTREHLLECMASIRAEAVYQVLRERLA